MKRKVTSKDVAKAAGVSQSLVSLVLNNVPGKKIRPETRELILKTAKELNYKVNINARNMKVQQSAAIGLLSSWDTSSFVFPPIIKGVQAACVERDLGVVICSGKTSRGSNDFIDFYLENRIGGLIYISYVGVPYEGVISKLKEMHIPFVCIIGARDLPGVSCVDVSFLESGYKAGKHLIDKGFRKICYLAMSQADTLIYSEKERYIGCSKAITEGGGSIDLVPGFDNRQSEDKYIERISSIMDSNSYDAFVSTSYYCHLALKTAARKGIKVPDDIGVVSLDNDSFAPYLYPSLTTVDQPLYDMAVKAVNILLDNMKDRDHSVCQKVELPPCITIRESSKRE